MRIFSPLPSPALEGLARSVERIHAPAGEVIVHQGDTGDHYYAIAAGDVDVATDGRTVATLSRGDGFGEIALLRDVPRTATVTARSDVTLYALEREPFLVALTGHAPSSRAAEEIVGERVPELARP